MRLRCRAIGTEGSWGMGRDTGMDIESVHIECCIGDISGDIKSSPLES